MREVQQSEPAMTARAGPIGPQPEPLYAPSGAKSKRVGKGDTLNTSLIE